MYMDSKGIVYLFEKKDFSEVIKYYEEYIDNKVSFNDLKEEEIYAIVFSYFYFNKSDDIYMISFKLKKVNVFSFSYLFLIICNFIKKLDFLNAIDIIEKSKLLENEEIIEVMGEDESSYTNILSHGKKNEIPCLLLIVLLRSLNIYSIKTIDSFLISYYEMLDIIYQSSCDEDIIDYLRNFLNFFMK